MSAETRALLNQRHKVNKTRGVVNSAADAALMDHVQADARLSKEKLNREANQKDINATHSKLEQGWEAVPSKTSVVTSLVNQFAKMAGEDGLVPITEAIETIRKNGLDCSTEELIQQLDVDADGNISLEEFVSWYFSHDVRHEARCNELAQEAFDKYDADQNGAIDLKEFVQACRDLKCASGYKLWPRMDLNSDGQLSFLEFKAFYYKYCKTRMELQAEKDHWAAIREQEALAENAHRAEKLSHQSAVAESHFREALDIVASQARDRNDNNGMTMVAVALAAAVAGAFAFMSFKRN